jgi:hypothetical protein
MSKYLLPALLALAAQAAFGAGQALPAPTSVEIVARRDAAWVSYRQVYKAASRFAEITNSSPLIQSHLQIVPRREGLSLEGLHLTLAGETVAFDIPVDQVGRARIPLLKKPFDEDAVLRLNRQQDNFRFTGLFSMREKDDGVYRAAELRAACEQIISGQRDTGSWFGLIGKKCAGVRFIYLPAAVGAALTLRDAAGQPAAIAAADGAPFDGVPTGMYKVVTYRFDAWPAQGDVVASQRPLFIGTLYE